MKTGVWKGGPCPRTTGNMTAPARKPTVWLYSTSKPPPLSSPAPRNQDPKRPFTKSHPAERSSVPPPLLPNLNFQQSILNYSPAAPKPRASSTPDARQRPKPARFSLGLCALPRTNRRETPSQTPPQIAIYFTFAADLRYVGPHSACKTHALRTTFARDSHSILFTKGSSDVLSTHVFAVRRCRLSTPFPHPFPPLCGSQ